jgi:hypothetical protein
MMAEGGFPGAVGEEMMGGRSDVHFRYFDYKRFSVDSTITPN